MFGWFRRNVKKVGVFGVEVEFHPPPEADTHLPASRPAARRDARPGGAGATGGEPSAEHAAGMTFDAVVRAIRESHPDAVLGRTAEAGPYFERAKGLTNYRLHTADPPWYEAVQPNGRSMWLYLGRGGKICCGDKE